MPIAMKSTVLVSLEDEDRMQCVDLFERADGTFGFEQYRSESDGMHQWQSLDRYSRLSFASGPEALDAAKRRVSWLDQAAVWCW